MLPLLDAQVRLVLLNHVAVRLAVEGFLTLAGWEIWLVEDAVRAARPEAAPELLAAWRARGLRTVDTEEALRRIR